jgi:hypothetical protein
MHCRLQISGNLQGDTVLQVMQQGVRQAKHASPVSPIGIHGYAEQEPNDQADATDWQADAQQSEAPTGSLRQRIDINIDYVQTIGQSRVLCSDSRS